MSWIELIGAVLSVWAVWLTAQRRPWCWPVGLVSVAVYTWVFVDARLYSDALLQLAFGGLILYGWHRWTRHLDTEGRVEVAPLPRPQLIAHMVIGALGAFALGFAMHRWTDRQDRGVHGRGSHVLRTQK